MSLLERVKQNNHVAEPLPCSENCSLAPDTPAPAGRPRCPVEALPAKLRAYVAAAAVASQTLVDLAAISCLGVCSAAIAGRFRVAARPGTEQPATLFVASITQGLSREADIFAQAKQPLQTLEAEQIDQARVPRIEAPSILRQAKIRLRQREKQAAGDMQKYREAALEFAKQVDENRVPALPRLLFDDTTTEKLSSMLAAQNGRLARFSTDTAARDLLSGSTSRRSLAEQALYRKAYRGEDLTLDLRGGERCFVRRSALTCSAMLAETEVAGLRHGRGRRSRGVLDAFLFAWPEREANPHPPAPQPIPGEVLQQYDSLIRSLAARQFDITFTLTSAACQRWEAWQAEVATMMQIGGPLEMLAAWADHLPGNTLRIAAILHSINDANELEISAETIEAAIAIARYFIPHALATHQLLSQQPGAAASCFVPTSPAERPVPKLAIARETSPRHTPAPRRTPVPLSAAASSQKPSPKSQPNPRQSPVQQHTTEREKPTSLQSLARPVPDRPPNPRGSGPRKCPRPPTAKRRNKR